MQDPRSGRRAADRAVDALFAYRIRQGLRVVSQPDREASYESYLGIRTPSAGKASRMYAATTGRSHIVLSALEASVLQLLDHNPSVVDIREQYPLRHEKTKAIARASGIRHPVERVSGAVRPKIMSTDFRVTRNHGRRVSEEAIAVKPYQRSQRKRESDKLLIEELYWEDTEVSWRLITEQNLPRDYLHNLRWVQGMEDPKWLGFDLETVQSLIVDLEVHLRASGMVPLTEALRLFAQVHYVATRDCLALVRHALAAGYWNVDWSVRIQPLWSPLPLIEPGDEHPAR